MELLVQGRPQTMQVIRAVPVTLIRVREWRPGEIMVGSVTGKFQKTFGSSGPELFIADRGHPVQIVTRLLKSQDLDTEISPQHFTECPRVLRVTMTEISF